MRDAILDATLKLVTERGPVAATVADVRRASGASVGAIYHHFPGGKDALVAGLYVDSLERYQQRFAAALDGPAAAEDGIRRAVDTHLAWIVGEPDRARLLLAERPPAAEDAVAALNRGFLGDVMTWWRAHAAVGALRDVDLNLAHALWLGPAMEYGRLWLADRAQRPSAADRRALADAAWAATKGP